MIHRALNSIPARPVLYIAPLIIVLVLAFYYFSLRSECVERASQRQAFAQYASASADSGSVLKLSDITGFPWQQVKGFVEFKPRYQTRSCPFGWDWSREQRQELIASGLLSVLIFFNKGTVSNYIEFRGDRILMEDFDKALPPGSAVFRVEYVDYEGAVRMRVLH